MKRGVVSSNVVYCYNNSIILLSHVAARVRAVQPLAFQFGFAEHFNLAGVRVLGETQQPSGSGFTWATLCNGNISRLKDASCIAEVLIIPGTVAFFWRKKCFLNDGAP